MPDDAFDAEDFPEELYLVAFGDVRMAVMAGAFESGYQHYLAYGRAEIEAGIRHSPFEGGPPGSRNRVLPPADDAPVPASPEPIRNGLVRRRDALSAAAEMPAGATPAERFNEDLYLALNPDVAALVESGGFASGRAHWEAEGAAEKLSGLRPSITDDSLYTEAVPPGTDCEVETANFDAESYFLLYPDVRTGPGQRPGGRAPSLGASRPLRGPRRHRGRTLPQLAGAPGRGAGQAVRHQRVRPFRRNQRAGHRGPRPAARDPERGHRHRTASVRRQPRARRASRRSSAPGTPTYRCNLILANADQIARLTALYPAGHFDDAYNIAVWAWELAAFRPDWHTSFAPLDEVWTNSDFEIDSIGAVAPVPVHKIRLPVEVIAASAAEGREMFGIPRDRLVFLVAFDVGSTSARKNPGMVIDAFREAFAADENVFLVIKFHSTAIEPAITRQLTRALRGAENVLVMADMLSEQEMALLRAACDVSRQRASQRGVRAEHRRVHGAWANR